MSKFKWETEFELGHAEIDRQHKGIVAIMNKLYDLLQRPAAQQDAQIEEVFDELACYVTTHFAYEEELMTLAGYPTEKISGHKKTHDAMLVKVQGIAVQVATGNRAVLEELLPFLYGGWLIDHICGTDRDYASYVLT